MTVSDPRPAAAGTVMVPLWVRPDCPDEAGRRLHVRNAETLPYRHYQPCCCLSLPKILADGDQIPVAPGNGAPPAAGAQILVAQTKSHRNQTAPAYGVVVRPEELLVEVDSRNCPMLPLTMRPGAPARPMALVSEERPQRAVQIFPEWSPTREPPVPFLRE